MSKPLIDADIKKAATLPSSYYTDSSLFLKFFESMNQTWQVIGHESEFHSTVHPLIHLEDVFQQPLIRTNFENETSILANVCTHRGMILCQQSTDQKTIQCPYHGRTFQLNGDLKHMPGFEEVENFPTPSDDLPTFNQNIWNGIEFTSMNPLAPFETWIKPMAERMQWWGQQLSLKHDSTRDRQWDIKANWMLYVDNYLEGFHIPYVHPELNDALSNEAYLTECFEGGVLQIGLAKEGDVCFDIPEGHIDAGKRIAAYYWWMFPNLMFNFYPWGLSLNMVIPIDVETTRILFRSYVQHPHLLELGAGAELDKVELQDQFVVEGCMRGLKSQNYERGRYAPEHEKGVHHFHRILTTSFDK